jgi:hypothetical protein
MYESKIKQALSQGPMTVAEMMRHSDVPDSKQTWVIKALKTCIARGVVVQDRHLTDKRLYGGLHVYRLVPTGLVSV